VQSSVPYFSIVIPTYNRGDLVSKAIKSILNQDFADFEILVIDDGSTDHTEEVIVQFGDPRIYYFRKENGERGAARNYGRARAKGHYINFFDSDDLMYSNHLSTAKEMIELNNSPELFHLGYDFQTVEGEVTSKVDQLGNDVLEKAFFDNFLSCNGVFVRRDIAEKFPFEENRVLASAEDWELWIRLMSRFKFI
jgi:glycosyltransferase involved in cell wall biosynthesis